VKAVAGRVPAFLGLRMARVLVAPHPNNELRNAQRMEYMAVLPLSLSLSLSLCLSRSLFTARQTDEQARSNRYYTVLRGRRACCIRQKGEEESLRIAPTWFRRGLPQSSRWKAERFWIIVDEDAFLIPHWFLVLLPILERAMEAPKFTGMR